MKLTKLLTSLSAFTLLASSASANLLVYEGFDYTPAFTDPTAGGNAVGDSAPEILHGKGGTTEVGLSGTWTNDLLNGQNMYLAEGSLSFGDLQTSGNRVRFNSNLNNDINHRGITPSLSGTSTGELWFSFLGNKLTQTGHGAEREGIAITNQAVDSAQINSVSPAGLHGFGVGWNGGWRAYGWNGTAATESTGSFAVPRDGTETNLLVGSIAYGAGTGGADVFNLYHYDRAFAGGTVTADMANLVSIDSIEVDADESLLDTLNVTRQVNTAFDEIRVGESLGDVVTAVPEASTFALIGLSGVLLLRRRRS